METQGWGLGTFTAARGVNAVAVVRYRHSGRLGSPASAKMLHECGDLREYQVFKKQKNKRLGM